MFSGVDTALFVTGLANLLGIDASTIRVVGYSGTGARRRLMDSDAGGIQLQFAIFDDREGDADEDAAESPVSQPH